MRALWTTCLVFWLTHSSLMTLVCTTTYRIMLYNQVSQVGALWRLLPSALAKLFTRTALGGTRIIMYDRVISPREYWFVLHNLHVFVTR